MMLFCFELSSPFSRVIRAGYLSELVGGNLIVDIYLNIWLQI